MRRIDEPRSDSGDRIPGLAGEPKRHAWRRAARRWTASLAMIPMLGACGNLHSLPSPPGTMPQPPALPGPFENYDPARPPAFKRAPGPTRKAPPRTEPADEEEPLFGGVLRPQPSR